MNSSTNENHDKSKQHTNKNAINRVTAEKLKRRENVQKWKREIKGGGCELLSPSRATTVSSGWGIGNMLTGRAAGHTQRRE